MSWVVWMAILIGGVVPEPNDSVLRDHVDLIEVNHYHDAHGRHVFDQLIFYDWSRQKRRFDVRAWRLIKADNQLPRRAHRSGHWIVRWHDDGVLREVTATNRRETWTQHDPELIERESLAQEQRLELTSWNQLERRRHVIVVPLLPGEGSASAQLSPSQ